MVILFGFFLCGPSCPLWLCFDFCLSVVILFLLQVEIQAGRQAGIYRGAGCCAGVICG
jgi:hypothetical protein